MLLAGDVGFVRLDQRALDVVRLEVVVGLLLVDNIPACARITRARAACACCGRNVAAAAAALADRLSRWGSRAHEYA